MIHETLFSGCVELFSGCVEWWSGYISENVVVCIPLWCAEDMAPVRATSLPKMAFKRVDLPTPELPDSRVMRSWKISTISELFNAFAEIA